MTEQLSIEISAKDLTGQAFAAVQRSLGEISTAAQSTAKNVGEIGAQAEKGFGAMPIKAGAAAGAVAGLIQIAGKAVETLKAYHEETRKGAAAIADQAEALQMGTAQFQAISFAADSVGIRQEAASTALSRFSSKLGEAAGGGKSAVEIFEKLGVKILDNEGRLRSSSLVLQEAAEGLLRMGNADERAAAAKDLLGVSGARLLPLLRQLSGGMEEVERKARAAGVIISDEVVQSANRLENQSNATALAVRAFYAEIGVPIEIAALKAVESVVRGIVDAARAGSVAVKQLVADVAIGGRDNVIASLQEKRDTLQKQLENPPLFMKGGQATMRQQIAEIDQEIERLNTSKAKWQAAQETFKPRAGDGTMDFVINDGLPARGGGGSNPRPSGGRTGGGAGDRRDRIGEAIAQLQGETRAAQEALRAMLAGSTMPLRDLERSVELEKKIADEIAKLGKYDPKDPRVAQIREQVIAHENAEAALKKYATAARDAESIEKNVGSGRAFLAAETDRLNAALDTGRLSYEAYAVAMRDATEKAEDMRLKLEGQRGGVEGLVAGMQYAANQWARANRPFETGQRLMTDGFNLLKQATVDWSKNGVLGLQKFEQAFLSMLINVGFALAQSELMKLLGGTSGGSGAAGGLIVNLVGGLAGLLGGGSGNFAIGEVGGVYNGGGSISYGGPRAGGGAVVPGMSYLVGENGPEPFLPATPGTILPNAALSGGGAPVIHQTMYFGSDVNQATLRSWGERVKADTMAAIVARRRRGDSTFKGAFG